MCRFLNADGVISGANGAIEGYNLFSYCFNNPINLSDETGNWPSWKKIGSFLAGAAVAAIGIAAVIVAAPIVTAAASVGFIAGTVYAVGVVTCGFTAALCGGSIMGEAVTGNNPIKNSVGQENFDLMTAASTMGSLQGLGQMGQNSSKAGNKTSTKATTQPAGKPFKTEQRVGTVQIGVDPKTLKLNTAINPIKYQAAKIKIESGGMYGVVEVYSNGTVYNGNHRTFIGGELGIAVDTIVVFK